MTEASRPAPSPSQVPDLAPLVRRVIGERIADPATAQDLTQETLARLVAVERRLDPSALAPYAVVTARNAVRELGRRRERELRHGPRMLDPRQPEDPEERALQEEERRAVTAALERLPLTDRESLLAHDIEGVQARALAERLGTTPRAVSVRLSRARARLRVEYLLALRRVELPAPSCKPVLLALSAADKRQQRALGAGEHLVSCPTCAALSDPLVRRRRPLAALWPFLGLDHLVRWLRRTTRSHPAPTAAGAVAVTSVAVWAVMALGGGEAPTLFVQAESSIPLSGDQAMDRYAGMTVEARAAPVQSVVDPTGFWVGNSRGERVWVDLHDQAGTAQEITPGRRISFQGTLTPNTPETLQRAERGGAGDRAQLERQGYHIDTSAATIRPG
ncbi:MAG: sigma-70 family RNA polymerase sigma factor [Actinomycetota bacterium]|nr:sigma-70 family RNA polymerase sigma factor [Actinomycetota bacterium]